MLNIEIQQWMLQPQHCQRLTQPQFRVEHNTIKHLQPNRPQQPAFDRLYRLHKLIQVAKQPIGSFQNKFPLTRQRETRSPVLAEAKTKPCFAAVRKTVRK